MSVSLSAICTFTVVFIQRLKVQFAIFTMSDLIEQKSAIKFCLRNEISAAETLKILRKAFSNSTMSQKNGYKWYKDFKEGRERFDDLKRSERPSTSTDDQNVNKVKELVLKNRRLTDKDLTDMIGRICENNFERPFGPTKSQISFGTENAQFLGKKSSR